MFVIVVYDIEQERVNNVNKFLKRFLNWRQNSVFEGNIQESQFEKIKSGIKELIDENTDSVYFYILPSDKYLSIEVLGIERNPRENIL
ncbi:MAG: CRISPR-associated endonuclease Cas2 [Nitrososphaeria archaeon]